MKLLICDKAISYSRIYCSLWKACAPDKIGRIKMVAQNRCHYLLFSYVCFV
jgi:hypothetical protein